MIKKILGLMFVFSLVFQLMGTTVYANQAITIRLNDVIMGFDTDPYIKEGRSMLPVRTFAEALGATEVIWNGDVQKVAILYEELVIIFQIGSVEYTINEVAYEMDVAPIIIDGRTMVPVRVLAEILGCTINWNSNYWTVEITKENYVMADDYVADFQYTYEDVTWLARIVTVEALNIGYEAKLAVANVVLNRVKNGQFPNSIQDVIFDRNYAVQFPPAHRDSFQTLEPFDDSLKAAVAALSGVNNISECLYFNNKPFKGKSSDLYKIIEGEYFYY